MTKQLNFEKSLEQLDTIVKELEQGDLALEISLKKFEQGVKLIRDCQQALSQSEQKVSILLEENGQTQLTDFHEVN